VKLPLIVLTLMSHTDWLYKQSDSRTHELRWVVRPDAESGVLTRSQNSRIEGDHRLIGKRGTAIYSFRILSGMDVQIQLTIGGHGRVRVRSGEQGLLQRLITGRVQTYIFVTRTPYQPPLQTLQVIVEADRRGRVVLYGLILRASQRDEDGDGIGDGTERLLGAPANALKPAPSATGANASTERFPTDWVQMPVLLNGEYQSDPFSMTFLRCGMLAGQGRARPEPRMLAMVPMLDRAVQNQTTYSRPYFSTLVAMLMFPPLQPAVLLEPLQGQSPAPPPDEMARLLSAARAVEAMTASTDFMLDAGVEGIGMLVPVPACSEQPSELNTSNDSNMLALALPLVRAGIPLQLIPPSRLTERNALRNVRLLLWTPEAVLPRSEAEISTLADWVRNGGWLLVIGVPHGDSAEAQTTWRSAGYPTPLHWLAVQLGLNLSCSPAEPEVEEGSGEPDTWQEVARHGTQPEQGTLNRRWVTIDLSPYAGQTVYVRFSDSLPNTGWGARLRQIRLEADGRILAAFYTGTSVERLFLYAHSRSQLTRTGERSADNTAWFVYRFTLPNATRILLSGEIAQEWRIELSRQPPYPERVLVRQRTDLPMLTLRHNERLARYELTGAEVLYLYQPPASASPIPVGVLQPIGRGGVVLLGVSAVAFSNSPSGEAQVRQWMRFVAGRAGLRYRERARFTVQRGDWTAAYGTYRTTILRGLYLDALDPRLPILSDVPLEPRTPRLLLRVDERVKRAGMLHTNAQIVLQHITPAALAYLLRGAEGVPGVARVSIRGLTGQVQLLDGMGNPAPVNVERTGDTLLIRWNLSQQGHVLLVR